MDYMAKKVKIHIELSGGDEVTVPDWVKTEKDLETFIDDYVDLNISVDYDVVE